MTWSHIFKRLILNYKQSSLNSPHCSLRESSDISRKFQKISRKWSETSQCFFKSLNLRKSQRTKQRNRILVDLISKIWDTKNWKTETLTVRLDWTIRIRILWGKSELSGNGPKSFTSISKLTDADTGYCESEMRANRYRTAFERYNVLLI